MGRSVGLASQSRARHRAAPRPPGEGDGEKTRIIPAVTRGDTEDRPARRAPGESAKSDEPADAAGATSGSGNKQATTSGLSPAPAPAPVKTRVSFIDIGRALSAVLVVYAHFDLLFLRQNYGLSTWFTDLVDNGLGQPLGLSDQTIGAVAVPVFFLISGFVVTPIGVRMGTLRFATNRFFRVYPTMFVVVLLAAGAYWIGLRPLTTGHPALNIGSVLLNVSLVNFIQSPAEAFVGVAWTLLIEVMFYLLVTSMAPVLRRLPWLAILIELDLILVVLCTHGLWGPNYHAFVVNAAYLTTPIMGQVMWAAWTKRIPPWLAGMYLLAAWGLFVWASDLNIDPDYIPRPLPVGYALILFTLGMFAEKYLKQRRFWTELSERSYSIYLLHGVAAFPVMHLVVRSVPPVVTLLIGLAVTAVAVELSFRLVERPSHNLGRKLSRRATERPARKPKASAAARARAKSAAADEPEELEDPDNSDFGDEWDEDESWDGDREWSDDDRPDSAGDHEHGAGPAEADYPDAGYSDGGYSDADYPDADGRDPDDHPTFPFEDGPASERLRAERAAADRSGVDRIGLDRSGVDRASADRAGLDDGPEPSISQRLGGEGPMRGPGPGPGPERSARPERLGRADRLERLERAGRPGRPNGPGQPNGPAGQPNGPDRAGRPENPGAGPARMDGPGPERPARIDGPSPERSGRTDGPGAERPARMDGPGPERSARIDGPGADRAGRMDGPGAERSGRMDGPLRPGRLDGDGSERLDLVGRPPRGMPPMAGPRLPPPDSQPLSQRGPQQPPNGTPQSPNGGPQLPNGARQLPNGAGQPPNGVGQPPNSAGQFPNGGPQLPNGAPQRPSRDAPPPGRDLPPRHDSQALLPDPPRPDSQPLRPAAQPVPNGQPQWRGGEQARRADAPLPGDGPAARRDGELAPRRDIPRGGQAGTGRELPGDSQAMARDSQALAREAHAAARDPQAATREPAAIPRDPQAGPRDRDSQAIPRGDQQAAPREPGAMPRDPQAISPDSQAMSPDSQGRPRESGSLPRDERAPRRRRGKHAPPDDDDPDYPDYYDPENHRLEAAAPAESAPAESARHAAPPDPQDPPGSDEPESAPRPHGKSQAGRATPRPGEASEERTDLIPKVPRRGRARQRIE
ncbi:MAG TPA: acyltransferase family protein [Pseudonocardiaceae bacterium]|nr:acyltransferase family protein [Pseudonocardiaceae bacterium]